MAMEPVVVRYCFTCKQLRPPEDHHCTKCGAVLVAPGTDSDLNLEIAAKILDGIRINGDGNDVIIRKLRQLSLALTSEDIRMKFCLKCGVEKSHKDNYCASKNCMGAKLIVPSTSKERLEAMQILLKNIQPADTAHYEILRAVWTAITQPG